MKKFLGLVISLALIMGLAACSNSGSETEAGSNTATEAVENDGKIHINYWYAWKDKIGESKENLVRKFNESQDRIVVHANYQGSYNDLHSKTQAAFAAGEAPEVYENEIASLYTFAKGGLNQDLTNFVTDDLRLEDFNQGLMKEAYVDGKLYGLPYYRSTPILYKNVDMLKAAGLDPEGPRDWTEFKMYLEKLRDKENDVYGLSTYIYTWIYEAYVASSGGALITDGKPTLNDPGALEAAQFMQDLVKADLMKVTTGEQASETSKQDFINQKSAFMYTSTADLSYFLPLAEENGYELATGFIPKNKEYAVPTGGANIVMTNGLSEEKQKAAWEFMTWMTDTEQTAYSSSYTGYLPARYSALETETLQNLYKEKPQFKVAVDQLEYAVIRPIADGWPEVGKLLADTLTLTTTEGQDVKQSFDDLQMQAESILK